MDRPGLLKRAALVAALTALLGGVAACGGDDGGGTDTSQAPTPQQAEFEDTRDGLETPEPALDNANRQPRGPSVNWNDPPPPIAAAVTGAAQNAGCEVTAFNSERDAQQHIPGESVAEFSVPPVSGGHNERWADYGVYDRPIPYKFQLHNLEHGGVVVHYGTEVPVAGVNALRALWADSPAYLIVVPDTSATFPTDAVVVGSQQRWMVCKPFQPAQASAVKAFVEEYRGRGPEQIFAGNTDAPRPDGLPEPAIPDRGAQAG